MIGSTIPGLTADVMRADAAARLRVAEEGLGVAAMKRELRQARLTDRRARLSSRVAAVRRHSLWLGGQLTHHPRV